MRDLEVQIKSKLDSLGVRWTQRGDEITCRCLNPEHKDTNPSFSINAESGLFNCFACGYSGSIQKLLDITEDEEAVRYRLYKEALTALADTQTEAVGDIGKSADFLPPRSVYEVPHMLRGIPKHIYDELDIYWCDTGKYRGRLIFPLLESDGAVLGFDARVWQHPDAPPVEPYAASAKYLRPSWMKTKDLVYGIDYIINHMGGTNTVLVCEGVYAAISYLAMGIPAVANFGLSAPSTIKIGMIMSTGATSIINAFDYDTAGIDGWAKVRDQWAKYFTIEPPLEIQQRMFKAGYTDINDFIQDIGETI